jgi:hypothetical protein
MEGLYNLAKLYQELLPVRQGQEEIANFDCDSILPVVCPTNLPGSISFSRILKH